MARKGLKLRVVPGGVTELPRPPSPRDDDAVEARDPGWRKSKAGAY
jgi:hypothetical protein